MSNTYEVELTREEYFAPRFNSVAVAEIFGVAKSTTTSWVSKGWLRASVKKNGMFSISDVCECIESISVAHRKNELRGILYRWLSDNCRICPDGHEGALPLHRISQYSPDDFDFDAIRKGLVTWRCKAGYTKEDVARRLMNQGVSRIVADIERGIDRGKTHHQSRLSSTLAIRYVLWAAANVQADPQFANADIFSELIRYADHIIWGGELDF